MGDNKLNLRGLSVTFWGSILMLLASFINGALTSLTTDGSNPAASLDMQSPTTIATLAIGALSIIGIIMTIVGLSMSAKISDRFRSARNRYLLSIILGVVATALIIGSVALMFAGAGDDTSSGVGSRFQGGGLVLFAVALVVAILASLFGLLYIKSLMGGCAELAKNCGDKSYSGKCTRTWVFYILFLVVAVACSIAAVISGGTGLLQVAESSGGSITSITDSPGMSSTTLILILIALVSGILAFILQIVAIFRVKGTHKRFNGFEKTVDDQGSDPGIASAPEVAATASASANPFVSSSPETKETPEPVERMAQAIREGNDKPTQELSDVDTSVEASEDVPVEEITEESLKEKVDELQAMIDEVKEEQ